MDSFPPPQQGQSSHSSLAATPTAQPLQSFFPQTNEQAMWLQQQQQHQQQAALLQLHYAQQARSLGMNLGLHTMNTSMLSNPFSTLTPGLAPSPNVGMTQNFPAPFFLLQNPLVPYPLYQHLTQPTNTPPPPPPSIPLSSSPNPPNDQANTESSVGRQSSVPASFSGSNPSEADTSPMMDQFTAVDDIILAKALHECESSAKAIANLDGTRDHSSSAWQAYYTSRRFALDKMVRDLYSTESPEMPAARTSSCSSSTRIPGIPVEEPSPSTKLVPHSGGYKYTDEDDEYFTRYILWRFSRDVEATKLAVCQVLSEKASHHSMESWKTYWWSRDKDIEHVRQLFKNGTPPKLVTSFRVTSIRLPRDRRISPAVPITLGTTSRPLPPADTEKQANEKEETPVSETDLSTSESSESDDDQQVDNAAARVSTSQSPIFYTKSDMQAVVKHMAEYPDLSFSARWDAISKLRPSHTSKAWGEYYRRNQATIDRRVRRSIRRRTDDATSPTYVTVVLKDKSVTKDPVQPQTHPSPDRPVASLPSTSYTSSTDQPRLCAVSATTTKSQPQLQETGSIVRDTTKSNSQPCGPRSVTHTQAQATPATVSGTASKPQSQNSANRLVARPASGSEAGAKTTPHPSPPKQQHQPTTSHSSGYRNQPSASRPATRPHGQPPYLAQKSDTQSLQPPSGQAATPRRHMPLAHYPPTSSQHMTDPPVPTPTSRSKNREDHPSAAHPATPPLLRRQVTQTQYQKPFLETRSDWRRMSDPRTTVERAWSNSLKRKDFEETAERDAKRPR